MILRSLRSASLTFINYMEKHHEHNDCSYWMITTMKSDYHTTGLCSASFAPKFAKSGDCRSAKNASCSWEGTVERENHLLWAYYSIYQTIIQSYRLAKHVLWFSVHYEPFLMGIGMLSRWIGWTRSLISSKSSGVRHVASHKINQKKKQTIWSKSYKQNEVSFLNGAHRLGWHRGRWVWLLGHAC